MRAVVLALPLVVLASASASSAVDAGAPDGGAPGLPACVQVTSEARFAGYAYNHIVHVRNGCGQAAACIVATDVSPEAQRVDVAPTTTADVTTFMGSPSSTFVAKVSCTLH